MRPFRLPTYITRLHVMSSFDCVAYFNYKLQKLVHVQGSAARLRSFVRHSFTAPLVHFQSVRVECPFTQIARHELRQVRFPVFLPGGLMVHFARHCNSNRPDFNTKMY